MKRIFCLAIFFVLCLHMSGCSKYDFFEIQKSMLPPRLTNDEQNIKDVITEYTGGKFLLKYPRRGNLKSAIITENLTLHGKYAIAFYQLDNELAEMHFVVLHNNNGFWKIVSDIINYKTNINYIDLNDIDSDGFKEIIINWENIDANKDDTSIYKYDGNQVIEVHIPNVPK